MINYNNFPNPGNPCMRDGMRNYLEYGILPGSFLTAVLQNDLRGVVERADDDNRRLIPDYIVWLYNNAPARSWGNPETVAAWIAMLRKGPQ